ncbi:MAG: TRAP transporter small permease subunit [Deltaproteobacteria bacterium]|nr:TRAP transporter small permease subunit [Deltaproteobacteria bacterium]
MKKPILKSIDSLSILFGKFCKLMIVATIAAIIPEVISRYLYGRSFVPVHDLVWMFCGTMYMLGGSYTLLQDGHVKVDVIYARFQPRTRAILDIITFPLFCAFCGVLCWQGAKGFWDSFKVLETTVTPWGGPVWLFKLTIPIGAFLLLLQGLAKFIRDLKIVVGREKSYAN